MYVIKKNQDELKLWKQSNIKNNTVLGKDILKGKILMVQKKTKKQKPEILTADCLWMRVTACSY